MKYALIATPKWDTETEIRYDFNISVSEEKIKGIKNVLVPFTEGKMVSMTVVRRVVIYDNGTIKEV